MKRIIFLIVLTILITNCTKDEFIQNDQFIDDIELDTRGQKIDVCHNGNIINVSINAVSAHEAHGDAVDIDGDGYFDALNDCIEGVDCNDTDPTINPDAEEVPYNGVDDDCNAATPDDDLDGDGFVNADDCNDNNFDINPGAAEVCDNDIDDNCDGEVDEGCIEFVIGAEAFGGIIFYIDGNGGGLVCSESDIASVPWDETPHTERYFLGGTQAYIGSGQSNTTAIIEALGAGNYAAKVCADYEVTVDGITYSDWFLPSKDEFNQIYVNLYLEGLGGLGNHYWTSTEGNKFYAWKQSPPFNGHQGYNDKIYVRLVRAVRAF